MWFLAVLSCNPAVVEPADTHSDTEIATETDTAESDSEVTDTSDDSVQPDCSHGSGASQSNFFEVGGAAA